MMPAFSAFKLLRASAFRSHALLPPDGWCNRNTQHLRARARRRRTTVVKAINQPINSEDLNKISSEAVRAMVAGDQPKVRGLIQELEGLRGGMLSGEADVDGAHFVTVLQSLLHHTVPADAARLEGPYLQAFNRVCNAVQGSEWKLAEEGKSSGVPDNELKFSSWDDVMNGKKKERESGTSAQSRADRKGPLETGYYDILQVAPAATQEQIKASYRKLALQLHPDVNSAADANQRFAEVSAAYDILSDPMSRELYDRYGAAGMKTHAGAESGRGNSERFWSEFKPYKRENKHTRARSAAQRSADGDIGVDVNGSTAQGPAQPQAGDVVEYPLSEVVKAETQDYSRTHGVGLLVSRNMDRGDAHTLPPALLQLCEIEPLRQEEEDSNRWVADELLPCAFNNLGDLKVVPVDQYDRRFDIWVINTPLSEGCAGPPLPEEIML